MTATLAATDFLDHRSAAVRDFVARSVPDPEGAAVDKARQLYYAVRDGIRYEIYGVDLSRRGLKASAVIEDGAGLCLHKSVLFAAAARALGIPSRLVLTDVRNHLASPRLRSLVGGDVFRYHCLVSVRLDGCWIKTTPVFNGALCRLFGLTPLEFDGTKDSLHHPFDEQGRRHMEFLHQHGEFDDLPFELVTQGLRQAHPGLFARPDRTQAGALQGEAPGHPQPAPC